MSYPSHRGTPQMTPPAGNSDRGSLPVSERRHAERVAWGKTWGPILSALGKQHREKGR